MGCKSITMDENPFLIQIMKTLLFSSLNSDYLHPAQEDIHIIDEDVLQFIDRFGFNFKQISTETIGSQHTPLL